MKQIPVGKNHFALVDDEDYEDLIQFTWTLRQGYNTNYAARRWPENNQLKTESMHKRITGYDLTDHINFNGLDNQKFNLRSANRSTNQANKTKQQGLYTSKYKGVSKSGKEKWRAQIVVQGVRKSLGGFDNEIDAAKAYDIAARLYFGEFAYCNFSLDQEIVF